MRIDINRKLALATFFTVVFHASAYGGGGMPGNACQRIGWGFGPGYHAAQSPEPWNGHCARYRCHAIAGHQGSLIPSMLHAERLDANGVTHGWPVPTEVRSDAWPSTEDASDPPALPAPPVKNEAPISTSETPREPAATPAFECDDSRTTDAFRQRHPPAHLLGSALFAAPRMSNTP